MPDFAPSPRIDDRSNRINSLFSDIETYNEGFSLGSMLGFLMRAHSGQPVSLSSFSKQQINKAEVLAAIHESTLKEIGLSLEPVSGKTFRLIGPSDAPGETGTVPPGDGKIRLNISDSRSFLEFLDSLQPAQLKNTKLGQNVKSIAHTLADQMRDHYSLENPGDHELELLRALEPVVERFKDLGLQDAVASLDEYLKMAKQHCLREFLAIEKAGLLQEPGKAFGPGDWQKDCSADFLQKHWDDAIALLRELKKRPEAASVFSRIHAHLASCNEAARTDLRTLSEITPDNRSEFERILDFARLKLETMML